MKFYLVIGNILCETRSWMEILVAPYQYQSNWERRTRWKPEMIWNLLLLEEIYSVYSVEKLPFPHSISSFHVGTRLNAIQIRRGPILLLCKTWWGVIPSICWFSRESFVAETVKVFRRDGTQRHDGSRESLSIHLLFIHIHMNVSSIYYDCTKGASI